MRPDAFCKYDELAGQYATKSRAFLDSFARALSRSNQRYLVDFGGGDFPLFRKERGWSAHAAAALSTITSLYLSEEGVKRGVTSKAGKVSPAVPASKGRMDFWAFCDPHDIGIELKSCFVRLGALQQEISRDFRDAKSAWESVYSQAEQVLAEMICWDDCRPISIPFLALPVWERPRHLDGTVSGREAAELAWRITKRFPNKPTWFGAWVPPRGGVTIKGAEPRRDETYLAVAFVALPLTHKRG